MAKLYIGCALALLLSGCTPLLLGGAAAGAAGVAVMHDRRSAGTMVDDNTLELKLAAALHRHPELNDYSHVNINTYDDWVLLTGEAASENVRQAIGALVQRYPGVARMDNQIVVGRMSTFAERLYDTQQTAKMKAALLSIPNLKRIKVVTEHGTTYLMGLVNAREAQEITNVTRHITGVRKIITLFQKQP